MEDSKNSSTELLQSSKERVNDDSQEESGWTAYFEDFWSSSRELHSSYSSGFGSFSVVSDAASCPGWKFSEKKKDEATMQYQYPSEVSLGKRSKELISLKKKNKILDDDELEDTASSPVNSPKVCGLNNDHELRMKARKKGENKDSFEGTTSGHCSELKLDASNELGFIGNKDRDYTELSKRGLCLVPLSMVVDYLAAFLSLSGRFAPRPKEQPVIPEEV